MNKNKRGLFLWRVLPILVILFAATVLVTWQITYNHTRRTLEEKYTEMLQSTNQSSDLSRLLYNVDNIVRGKYIGEIDGEKLTDYTISGYIYGLGDKYASYMSADEYSEYMLAKDGLRMGIGINVVYDGDENGLYILNVYDETPAAEAGLVPGEVITRVEGSYVSDIGYYKAIELIRDGDEGSSVSITVRASSGAERTVYVTRKIIEATTVTSRKISGDTGVIRISEFTKATADEFKNAIQSLTVNGVDRFVFDVRNNPGGDLQGISNTLDFLLPEGNIIIINQKNGMQSTIVSDTSEFSAPMVVLANENTASAAELFTAALRDYGKAKIVGKTTYGKGVMQEVISLPNGGAASISVSTYLPPSGVSYDGIGIIPDYDVSLPPETNGRFYRMTDEEDTQLQKALEIIADMELDMIQ